MFACDFVVISPSFILNDWWSESKQSSMKINNMQNFKDSLEQDRRHLDHSIYNE